MLACRVFGKAVRCSAVQLQLPTAARSFGSPGKQPLRPGLGLAWLGLGLGQAPEFTTLRAHPRIVLIEPRSTTQPGIIFASR
jgi:hypothetical protein